MIMETIDFMGIDHVAIGSDKGTNMSNEYLKWMRMGRWTHEMDYGAGSKSNPNRPPSPDWFKGPADFPNIVEGLSKKGLSKNDVNAVMGGKWKRFYEEGFKKQKV